MGTFEIARQKYRPSIVRHLLIAESPPKFDSNRFFYFENVTEQNSLFLEIMKCLYPTETINIKPTSIRERKQYFLEKFMKDGFYLIDSVDKPFEEKYSSNEKIRLLVQGQTELLNKIQKILHPGTWVTLIAATVFKANYNFLIANGINVVNKDLIDFPGSGGQKKFREKVTKLLNEINSKQPLL